MATKRIGDLELTQDMDFQRKSWRLQRAGWFLMAVLVLFALAGLFGDGPVSKRRAGGPGQGLEVEYERFGRRNAPQTLRFHITTPPDPEGKVRLILDREYLESLEIDGIAPEPESVEGGPDHHTFRVLAPSGDTTLSMKVRPEAMGRIEGTAAIEGKPPVRFGQLIYP